jgi:hypothetical protein
MIKKVIGILAIAAVMASCGSKEQKKEESVDKEMTVVTVDEFAGNLQNSVDQEIVIKGVVNHICKHGGKRMFIMGENPDVAIKITPNDQVGVFEQELVGSSVVVTGVVKELRIDEEYVASLENEVDDGTKSEALHDHSGGTHDEEAENEQKAQFEAMRAQIAESEKGYYSQFWIEANKFEIMDGEHNHEHAGDEEGHDHEHAEGEEHTH